MTAVLPLALLLALLVDRWFGEPPDRLHPVVGMGRYLDAFGPRLAGLSPGPAFIGGSLAWLLGALLCAALALSAEILLLQVLQPWRSLGGLLLAAALLALLLKPLLAWRLLADEVRAVEAALAVSLEAGRTRLAHLVSRDTSALSETEVREAALESLAENLNDSVIAPLFWFAVAGLPGAAVYRFANTADAMWGYRDHREWSGKFAARADDLLSWLPARLTALALAPRWLLRLPAEAARTPSPNSGWPMAALALRMDLSLGKRGVYRLHAQGRAPEAPDTAAAVALAAEALIRASLGLAVFALLLRSLA